jgi:tubulin polyglutamylase TTLL6/13
MENNHKPRKAGVKSNRAIINIAETKYAVIPYAARKLMGWTTSRQDDDCWDVWWTDGAVSSEKLAKMKPYQKINHFPGMFALARKNHLAKYLGKMRKQFPKDYNFFPKTWMLPGELPDFRSSIKPGSKKVYILKPDALS